MATFNCKSFSKHDDYMSPKYVWEDIKEYIPQNKVIWEAFYGDGKSGLYLQELGYEVIHSNTNFFDGKQGDILVSNPPFTLIKEIMTKLLEYDMPFILLMPCSKITTQYFRIWKDKGIQIIIPRKRIHFNKLVNGILEKKKNCNFDCFYYCYKMNLENSITWLE